MTHRKSSEHAGSIKICQGNIDYQGIVRHINEGVVIISKGKILFANNGFCQTCETPLEQVISSDFSRFVAPGDREEVTKYCTDRLIRDDLSDRIEFVMLQENGEAIIEMKVSVVDCGGSPALLGALTDITERRKTRLELQRMKSRLESILHSMNEVVVSFSPIDFSILEINPAAEQLYGIPLREFTSEEKHILRFVHPDDKEKVQHFYRNLPEAEWDEAEYRIISSNKQVKWVLDEGHIVYTDRGTIRRIDHVIRDITEQKKVLDALKQSEAKYRDFFESTTDMAFTITPEGIFMDINDAGLKLLGFESKEEALASNVEDFYVDLSEREGLLQEIYGKSHVEDRQVKFRNKAGDVIEVAITARAKIDDSGRLLYHEGIVHNITKALEDQRNRVLRNAAGGMCHYLNSHLMQLDGSLQLMAEETKSLGALIEDLTGEGANPREIADKMKELLESFLFSHEGISDAYERISEVTRAFNKAFLYKEEEYTTNTILDIFNAYGCEGENPKT